MEQIPHEKEAFRAPNKERNTPENAGPNTPENTSKTPYFDANSTPIMGTDPGISVPRSSIPETSQPESSESLRIEGTDPRVLETRAGRGARPRSSLRLRYEAETEMIRRKLGDLEDIRKTLGLSQRKMCQLLFVDPSAWTRWTKSGENAPPHIYRMLQWYLALQDKYPALDVNFWLQTVAQTRSPQENDSRDRRIAELSSEQARLQEELRQLRVFSGHTLMNHSREVEQASVALSSQLKDELAQARKRSKQEMWIIATATLGAGALLRGLWVLFSR